MSKLFLVAVFINVFAASLAEVEVSTNLSLVENGSTVLGLNGRPKVVNIVSLSKDDGVSNWGDAVYKSRQQGDVLLERHLSAHRGTSSENRIKKFRIAFRNVQFISSVRFINVGRQRAQATEIEVSGNQVEILYVIPAEANPRVFIEVYGFQL